MARIIKPGFKRVKEIRGTCKQCTCVFAVEPNEVEQADYDTERYASCPCCGADVTGLVEEWVTVSYDKPKTPPIRWWHDHI